MSTLIKAASTLISVLRTQPLALTLLIFNLAFIGLVFHATQSNAARHERLVHTLLERCK